MPTKKNSSENPNASKPADDKASQGDGSKINLDFGFGSLGLGGLIGNLDKLVSLAETLKKAGGNINQEGEVDLSNLKKGMKAVYGVSIRTDFSKDGQPVVESFGNVRKNQSGGATVEDEREPLTDVFIETDAVKIYAEMPGVRAEDIAVTLNGDIVEIVAATKTPSGTRKYRKEILLTAKVKSGSLTSTYNNGVLEISIAKAT